MSSAAKKRRNAKSSASKSKSYKSKGSSEEIVKLAEAQKWLDSLKVDEVINSKLFDNNKQTEIAGQYKSHTPFPCYSIKEFLEADFAGELEEELKSIDY